MKLIKKAGLFLCFIFCIAFTSKADEAKQVVLCSGTTVKIYATNYFTNSGFLWQKFEDSKWTNLTGSKEYIDFTGSSGTVKLVDVRCILSLAGVPYDTLLYKVKIMPVPVISKVAVDQLCVGKLSHFDFVASTNIVSQKWTFNATDSLLLKNPVWLIKAEGKIPVKLNVVNDAGCQSAKDTSFTVSSLPLVNIQRERLIYPDFYYDKVACGNDSTVFNFVSQGSVSTIQKWTISLQGTIVFERNMISSTTKTDQKYIKRFTVSGNKLSVVWNNQSGATEFLVGADYSTTSGCTYTTNIPVIILPSKTPDQGTIFQKPNNSKVLIYKPQNKDSDTTLNYQWGYTVNQEEINAGSNRFFNQFSEINASNKYWVETYYTESKECRSRTYFSSAKTKSVTPQTGSLKIFPNPANDYVTINLSGNNTGTIYLLDIFGNKLKSMELSTSDEVTWNLSQLNPGNYLIIYDDHKGNLLSEKLSVTY
jgi:hypothetical protein